MKVLLLGGSGLLGHNVLRELLARRYEVVLLVRSKGGICLKQQGYSVITGSLTDRSTLMKAACGCSAIINCAGTTDMSLLRRRDYTPVNEQLCRDIVDVVKYHGISSLVHVSTVNTIGYGTSLQEAHEDSPMEEPFLSSYYADSKRVGEEIVLSAAIEASKCHIVVINPGYMLGAYDVKPSSGKMLLAAYRKRIMLAPKGGKSFVHVADVAEAVVNALQGGKSGERYIVTNSRANLTIKQLYEMQAMAMGYKQSVVEVPDWLLLALAKVGDVLRWIGFATQLSSRNVRQLLVREYYCNAHAISGLHIKETPIEKAIIDFHSWRNAR